MLKTITLWLCFLIIAVSVYGAPIIVHQPPLDAKAGKPLVITATITDSRGQGINQVTLYVRTKGTLGYWQNPMIPRGALYSATIPKKLVLSAGIEYYIEVKDLSGGLTTSPSINANISPHQINVYGDQGGPQLELLSPEEGALLHPEQVVIVVGIESGSVPADLSTLKFYFDEQDVTDQVNKNPQMLSYVAPENLAPGLHGIRVEIKDNRGRLGKSPTWSLRVSSDQEAGLIKAPGMVWRGNLLLSSQYTHLIDEPSSSQLLREPEGFLNRLQLNANGELEQWRFLTQVDVSSEETPGRQPVNRFKFEAYRPEFSLQLGDSYPVFTELSLQNYFVRGGWVKLLSGRKQGVHSELQVVAGISKFPIEGRAFEYTTYLGTTPTTEVDYDAAGTFEQWVLASRYNYEFLPGTGLSLNFTSVNDFKNSIEEPAGAIGRVNHVVTAEGKIKIFFLPELTTSVYGEVGVDYYDEEQSITTLSIGDAYLAGNRWEWLGNSFFQIETRRIGANYVSLANPWLIADYEGIQADGQFNFLNNNLSLLGHVESWQDNLDGQKNNTTFNTLVDPQGVTITAGATRTMAINGSINFRLAPTLQSLFIQGGYNSQIDANQPIALVHTQSQVWSFGSTLLFPLTVADQLLGTISYTLNTIKNKADYRTYGDSQSRTLSMAGQIRYGSSLTLSAGLGLTQTDEINDGVQSALALSNRLVNQSNFNLRADYQWWPNELDVFANVDLLSLSDDQNQLDETVTTYSLGGRYYLPQQQSIMLTLSQIGTDDGLDDALDYSEFIINLQYGVSF